MGVSSRVLESLFSVISCLSSSSTISSVRSILLILSSCYVTSEVVDVIDIFACMYDGFLPICRRRPRDFVLSILKYYLLMTCFSMSSYLFTYCLNKYIAKHGILSKIPTNGSKQRNDSLKTKITIQVLDWFVIICTGYDLEWLVTCLKYINHTLAVNLMPYLVLNDW